jgi:hypothetical protein
MTTAQIHSAVAGARKVRPAPAKALSTEHAPEKPARSYDAGDLIEMDMPDPVYVCRPWVSEGVTLVVGRPKIGKTTLLRQLALQANTGGEFFSSRSALADVLFLSLEEGERIMRKKLAALGAKASQLRGIRVEFEWPQGGDGVAYLRKWLQERTSTRTPLVIIDSLTRFRDPPTARGNQFTEDYTAVKLLADLCKEFPGLVVLVLHHTTKASPDDPVSAISGTYGLTAAADNYLILLKQGQQFRLHAGGRLWEGDNSDFELKREAGGWALAGDWDHTAPQGLTPKQQQVIDVLRAGAKTNKTLAELTGQTPSALSHMLAQLSARGLINRLANGWELTR